ncbi:MAG: transporter substrate-binding domain-containing protein [Clostridia bacterium]|nr:transporter substrate-binding domain-containing protein [Clostridia bacterium]
MKMKKLLAAVLACLLVLSCTACGGTAETKTIASPDDFDGAKVSVQTATTAHDSLQEMVDNGSTVEILPYEKITQCFDDLELGRCDAVYVDSVVAAYYLTGDDSNVQSVWTSDEGEPMGICIKKGNTELLAAVEAAVDTLYANGKIGEIAKTHFGDNVTEGVRNVTEAPVIDTENLKTVKEGKLLVGFEAGYPPMEYTDDTGLNYIGFDVDLAKEIAALFGLEIEFVNTAWDGIFAGLDKDQYDMIISGVSITPDRQEAYEMTEPYISNKLVIVTKKPE